jgi:NTP pyrophosphatase (non-canonical NTP hydrolase)
MSDPSPAPDTLWSDIEALWTWLESNRQDADSRQTLLLRLLKLSEEVGEVAEAAIGAMGQNPRKGASHTWDDVRDELCDVVVTALVALRTMTPDPKAALESHTTRVRTRSLGPR